MINPALLFILTAATTYAGLIAFLGYELLYTLEEFREAAILSMHNLY